MTAWTEYQGIEVAASDPKVPCRHPRWGYDPKRLAVLRGASLIMLVDGIMLVVCNDCIYNGLTGNAPYVKPEGEYKPIIYQADSVLSHRNSTHDLKKPRGPMYSEDLIKFAIKAYLKWKATKIKNWSSAAAAELDALGFKPVQGEKWTGSIIVSLANRYMKEDRFKNIKAGPMSEAEQEALAEMVRAAAARNNGGLAKNVRITEPKKHVHTPVDFAAIIAAKTAQPEQEKEEAVVTATNKPTLSFAPADESVTPVMSVPATVSSFRKEFEKAQVNPPTVILSTPAYDHVTEVDGDPVFRYNGVLMVGKPVRGFTI